MQVSIFFSIFVLLIKKATKKNNMGKVKPLSPSDINIELPDFVIEAVNNLIKKNYRGGNFDIEGKDIIAEGNKLSQRKHLTSSDWYNNNWLDFEEVFRNHGWDVKYVSPSRGDISYNSYYTFSVKNS